MRMKSWSVKIAAILCGLLACGALSALELTAPVDNAELALLRRDWKERIAERSKRPRVSVSQWGPEDRLDRPEAAVFSWKGQPDHEYTLEIARDREFRSPVLLNMTVTGCSAEVVNLETGRTYFWRVRAGEELSGVRSFTTGGSTPRFLRVPGGIPVNFRDAGGKKTADGRRTRQGMIFRGSDMNLSFHIKPEGLRFMRDELGIRTDLDLRYPNQTSRFKASPLGDGVRWLLRPVNAYKSFTPEQNDLFRDTIRVFADRANYPIYVHCAAGVDRTGEIIFLLDMLLNVDEEQALLDYEASSLSYYPRPRSIPYFVNWLNSIRKMSPEGTPRAQQVVNYLLKIGVTSEEIESIRKIMLE